MKSIKQDITQWVKIWKPQEATEIPYKGKKKWWCKFCVIRELGKSFKKGWNYTIKSLVNVNRCVTFAPATATDVLLNTGKQMNFNWKNIFKKDFKKLVRFENGCYICTPQNNGSSLKEW